MSIDKNRTHNNERAPRLMRSSSPETEELWRDLRCVYHEAGKYAEFSPMAAGRIRQRIMVLKEHRIRKSRHSWNLAFTFATAFLFLLLILPLVSAFPRAEEVAYDGMRETAASFNATDPGTDGSLPPQAALAPKATPIPEPLSEDSSTPMGMGSESIHYRSVTLAWVAPEQIKSFLLSFPETQQKADGTLLLAQQDGDPGAVNLPAMERAVVFSEPIQGTEGMPIGSDLLLLAPSSSSTPGPMGWLALAWRAFLIQVWPWGLILVLVSLIFLYFFFRQRRLRWAAVFFIVLFISIIWPLLSPPSAADDRLLLESTDHVSLFLQSSWSMPTEKGVPLTILSAIGNPPGDSPFTLPLGSSPDKALYSLLESYGLRVESSEVTVQWISLPTSQLLPLQLTFLGLRAFLLFIPLFLIGWLTFSRGLYASMLKSEDRLPKLL